MSSPSSSCLNWVSCSCYSTDVSLTKSCSLMLWTFIHQALKANSDFIINSITLHQAPQIEAALHGKKKEGNITLQWNRELDAHVKIPQFSNRFHGFRSSTFEQIRAVVSCTFRADYFIHISCNFVHILQCCRTSAVHCKQISLKTSGL